MAVITAGSKGGETEPARLAVVAAATVLVLWLAHVYSDGLAESIERGRRLDLAEVRDVARREAAVMLAAAAPVAILALGSLDAFRDTTAVWVALGIGVATLGAQGFRYARLEELGWFATLASVATNVALGLLIVGLEVFVSH